MKQIFYISILVTLLSGCQLLDSSSRLTTPSEDQTMTMELPPKVISTDWVEILSPLVNELVATSTMTENNILLIGDVKNDSGSYVALNRVNDSLSSLLSQQNIFAVADKISINNAKQVLGIRFGDTSLSRAKIIGLARYLKTDYVLLSTIQQAPSQSLEKSADVLMELLLTKTGEIVWTFSSSQIVSPSDIFENENSNVKVNETN